MNQLITGSHGKKKFYKEINKNEKDTKRCLQQRNKNWSVMMIIKLLSYKYKYILNVLFFKIISWILQIFQNQIR